MENYLAMLLVAAVAAAFYGVSYLKKKKLFHACDRFADTYCELADRLIDNRNLQSTIATQTLDGGLFRILPLEEQPLEVRAALQKQMDEPLLASVRELYLLRDEIQAEASNGSFSKDKYNAITNQVFDSLNTYLSILKDPMQIISQKDLDQVYYVLQKQKHIRNITLASVVSRPCAERIAIESSE